MSGIEVAGLALGALPLIIQAIKVYADGVSTVERYFKYEIPLRDLHRAVEAEYVIYQNTCEELLNAVVEHKEDRAALLDQPGGPGWKRPELEVTLKERLSRSYPAYIGTMESMMRTVSEIKRLLKLDKAGKLQLNNSSKFRKEYHRLRFSLKKSEYDSLVSQMQQLNATLRTLTQQALVLEPTRSRRQPPDFDLIRSYTASVYNVICAGLKCGCRSTHGINLRLESIKKYSSNENLPPLRVALSYSSRLAAQVGAPWGVETVDVHPFQVQATVPTLKEARPSGKKAAKRVMFGSVTIRTSASATATAMEEPANSSNLVHIQNLCQAICSTKSACMGACLGYLEDETTKQRLSLHRPHKSFKTQEKTSILSLGSVLASNAIGHRRFSAGHRLRLAVLLSTNLLQLYRTPWLADTWDHNDIAFLDGIGDDSLKDPFVSCNTNHVKDSSPADNGIPVSAWEDMVLNRSLFALGILLIELCLGKPFEELRDGAMAGKGSVRVASDFAVANQLLDEVMNEFGDRYADAVRRCIRCAFDTRKIDLEDGQFRGAVYEGVVAPLEENLRDFTGLGV